MTTTTILQPTTCSVTPLTFSFFGFQISCSLTPSCIVASASPYFTLASKPFLIFNFFCGVFFGWFCLVWIGGFGILGTVWLVGKLREKKKSNWIQLQHWKVRRDFLLYFIFWEGGFFVSVFLDFWMFLYDLNCGEFGYWVLFGWWENWNFLAGGKVELKSQLCIGKQSEIIYFFFFKTSWTLGVFLWFELWGWDCTLFGRRESRGGEIQTRYSDNTGKWRRIFHFFYFYF